MWLGVILGLLGLGLGFFGLRKASLTEGRITEHNRQKRYAEMIQRNIKEKDEAIDSQTKASVKQIRRTTRLRLKTKSRKSVGSFLSRTKKPW